MFVSIVLAALGVASVPLFILYDDDEPAKADAVMVLAGAKNRLPVGLGLVERGVAPVLVISDGRGSAWEQPNRLCDRPRVLCPRPVPFSTRGEARLAAKLVRERGWDSLVVVSSRFHLFRARRLFERCTGAKLAFVGATNRDVRLGLWLPLEWVKLGVAAARRSC